MVYEGLQNAAKEGKQAIVILNRKGYDKRTEREDRSENRQKIGYVPHINRGTEKVLEEINETLDVRTALLDKSRSKSEIKKIIGDFNKEKIDVIVGTQMILEGLKQDKLKTIALTGPRRGQSGSSAIPGAQKRCRAKWIPPSRKCAPGTPAIEDRKSVV